MDMVALLTGFLQMFIWQPTLADLLLTVKPAASHYTAGQSITLTCSLTTTCTVEGFIFIKDGSKLGSFQAFGQQSKSYHLPSLSGKSTGRYSCKYWKKSYRGQNFTFLESNTVWISVRGSLPVLSPDPPQSLYLPGEQITLHCSAPNHMQGMLYRFFYQGEVQTSERVPVQQGGDWMTLTATQETSGEYTCQYSLDKESKEIFSSERSNPVLVSVIAFCQIFQLYATLQAPQLMATPRSSYFVTGQSVTLMCSQAGYGNMKKFTFFKDKIELMCSSEWTPNDRESYHIPQLSISDSGEYTCKYCTSSNKQPVHSLESSPVRITVLERPPLPVFSVSPKKEIYSSCEFVTLTCSVSDTRNMSKILFLKNKTELASSPFTHSLRLLLQGGGNYSCRYWVFDSQQEIPSQESNIIRIAVTDPPPRPVLEVDPPSGEVNEGDRLLFTCSTDRNDTEKRFRFYRDGVKMTSTEGFLWRSGEPGRASPDASVTILQARPSQTGGFACSYEEKNSSHWISSPWSQNVNITVLAQLPRIPVESAAVAILIPVLMLLLVVYGMRKKKASKGQQEFELTESKEEIDLDYLTPRSAALQKQEGSEITYADVQFSSAGTRSKPVVRNKLEPAEEEKVLYSRVYFQPTSRPTK